MKNWYVINNQFFVEERDSLRNKHDFLKMEVSPPGTPLNNLYVLKEESVLVMGLFRLSVPDSSVYYDYRISLYLPNNYPTRYPIMMCNDERLPIGNIDRHILSDGQACLAAPAEIKKRWGSEPRIVPFLDNLVAPFLAWQVYYDEYKQPPPWGQLSHGVMGIFEYYADCLEIPLDEHTYEFMKLLARKNNPKGHELCPCGSGRRLRNCHMMSIQRVREQITWKNVSEDLIKFSESIK